MTPRKVRWTQVMLLGIFLTSLTGQVTVFLALRERMWPEEVDAVLLKLFAIYSVHLGLMLGAIFAQARKPIRAASETTVWVAILLCALWNGLLVSRSIAFAITERDPVNEFIKYLDNVSAASSFLITGMLGFFFSTESQAESSKTS